MEKKLPKSLSTLLYKHHFLKSLSTILISIYVSVFLVFSPAIAQTKFTVGPPANVKDWTLTLSNGAINKNIQLRELRGDYLIILKENKLEKIHLSSISKISSPRQFNARSGIFIFLILGGISGFVIGLKTHSDEGGFLFGFLPFSGGADKFKGGLKGALTGSLIGAFSGLIFGTTNEEVNMIQLVGLTNAEKKAKIQKLMKKNK